MFGSDWKNKDTLHEDLGTFMLMSCRLREKYQKCGSARQATETRDDVDIIWGHTDTQVIRAEFRTPLDGTSHVKTNCDIRRSSTQELAESCPDLRNNCVYIRRRRSPTDQLTIPAYTLTAVFNFPCLSLG